MSVRDKFPKQGMAVFVAMCASALVGSLASAATVGSVQTRTWNESSIQVYAINVSSGDSSSISGGENLVITSPGIARAKWSDDGKSLTLTVASGFLMLVR